MQQITLKRVQMVGSLPGRCKRFLRSRITATIEVDVSEDTLL
jgi:hypothetical protein